MVTRVRIWQVIDQEISTLTDREMACRDSEQTNKQRVGSLLFMIRTGKNRKNQFEGHLAIPCTPEEEQ